MNAPKLNDPLLAAAKVVVIIACVAVIFAMVMLGIGIGAILSVERAEMLAKLAKAGAPEIAFWALPGAMSVIMVMLYMALQFFRALFGIIGSVSAGDPFDPANAARLALMGWLALGGQLIAIPLAALANWLESYSAALGDTIDAEFGLDWGAVLLTMILFILARVFRHGAAMRAELEGTV